MEGPRQLKCPSCKADVTVGQLKCSQCGTRFKCSGLFDEARHWYRVLIAVVASAITSYLTTVITIGLMQR
jgi:formate dehydrogenase maturation protein FdhE